MSNRKRGLYQRTLLLWLYIFSIIPYQIKMISLSFEYLAGNGSASKKKKRKREGNSVLRATQRLIKRTYCAA